MSANNVGNFFIIICGLSKITARNLCNFYLIQITALKCRQKQKITVLFYSTEFYFQLKISILITFLITIEFFTLIYTKYLHDYD